VIVDSHAHIHDKAYDDDREAVVARAREAGVATFVTVGCDLADSSRAIDAAQTYGVYASVGVHPHEAKDAPDDLDRAFAPMLARDRAIAVGETGLDYYYDHSPRDVQQSALRKQIRIAKERDLPVIFHHRDAFDDFVRILREEFAPGMRGVIHCFTGDSAQAQTYVNEFGLLLGIGGVVTFKTADPLRTAVAGAGMSSIVFETDCPYLAPIPHRGKRNEPAFVTQTARFVAELLDLSYEGVCDASTANARALFKLT
jgi:TatD DNase family protein